MGTSLGAIIRQFFRELFGSRLADRLEGDIVQLRNDYDTRLHERDVIIAEQRERIVRLESKVLEYEHVVIPLSSPMGSLMQPKRTPPPPFIDTVVGPSSWRQIQLEHERKQAEEENTNGVQDGRREKQEQQVPAEAVR